MSIGSNITDNTIRKVIDVYFEKCRTKSGALRNTNIKKIFLQLLPIPNHSKLSITEKSQNKTKCTVRNSI